MINDLPLLSKGSVKDIYGYLNKRPYVFQYSNRYSIFDWGEMPDQLEDKGKSLASLAFLFFEILGNNENWKNWKHNASLTPTQSDILNKLVEKGMGHHGISLVNEQNNKLDFGQFSETFAVRPMEVIRPCYDKALRKYDYSSYSKGLVETLVPLEVIFRFDITSGSSLLNRVDDQSYLSSMGVSNRPKAGDHYETPLIEFSTKLESTDRYLPMDEAQEISCMTSQEIQELKDMTTLLALRLKDIFLEIGVTLHDGKLEFAFFEDVNGGRTFQLIDSIGPDELRLSYQGKKLSKENLREFYRDGQWHKKMDEAKAIAKERGEPDWKSICENELKSFPQKLSNEELSTVSMIYKTLTNELFNKFLNVKVFDKALSLNELINKLP